MNKSGSTRNGDVPWFARLACTTASPRCLLMSLDGGPGRDRTDDLFHAMEARSQLRHRPTCEDTTLGANDPIYFRRVKPDSQRGRSSARPTATTLPRASAGCPI